MNIIPTNIPEPCVFQQRHSVRFPEPFTRERGQRVRVAVDAYTRPAYSELLFEFCEVDPPTRPFFVQFVEYSAADLKLQIQLYTDTRRI